MAKKLLSTSGFFLFVLTILFTGLLYSCKDKVKDESGGKLQQGTSDTSVFKMNCVILTKAQVQAWVDSAAPKKLKTLLLQFYTAGSSGIKANMQLVAYPAPNINESGAYGNTLLSIDTSCAGMDFTAATFPNNIADLVEIGVLDANGAVKDFDKVIFKPSKKYAPVLSFTVDVLKNNTTIMAKETNPCPPCQYCNPPCTQSGVSDL